MGKLLSNGLPSLGKGGIDTIPLDAEKIYKLNIYINDSIKADSGIDKKFDIYLKSIVIGDVFSIGTSDEYILGDSFCFCCSLKCGQSDTLSSKINDLNSDLTIYPNPAKDIITIETKATISQIEIINSIGLVVLQSKGQSQISVANLAKGIYMVRAIMNGFAVLTGGFVKE